MARLPLRATIAPAERRTTPVARRLRPRLLRRPPTAYELALGAALLLGVAIRLALLLASDFPLNDGGLFMQMAADLQRNGLALPAYTTYNHLQIPFAYSPLPIYLLAVLHMLTPLDWFAWLRILPFLATCAVLAAFVYFARTYLRDRTAVLCAVIAFAVLPRTWIWLLMGGGLTRAPGFLFAILALAAFYHALGGDRRRDLLLAGVCFGLAALCHIESAEFCAYSAVLMLLAYAPNGSGLRALLAMGAIGAAVATPWWATVLAQHGPGPFLAARSTGLSVFDASVRRYEIREAFRFGFDGTHEPLLPLVAFLAVVGGLYCLARGRLFLPVWTIVTVLMDYRAWQTFFTLPYCLLAGIALAELLLPAAGLRFAERPETDRAHPAAWPDLRPYLRAAAARAPLTLACVGLLSVAVVGALNRSSSLDAEQGLLTGLSHDDRAAMAWVQQNTPADARVVVLTGRPWFGEGPAEWFPTLTQRMSVDTIQGTEWLTSGPSFAQRQSMVGAFQSCATSNAACLASAAFGYDAPFDYVYVQQAPSSDCCETLAANLRADPDYRLVYDRPGAAIFKRIA